MYTELYNKFCLCVSLGDGRWYRALVEESTSNETFKVQFVDYGNSEVVTLDKLRQISSTFLKLPFQAIQCWLSGETFSFSVLTGSSDR